MNKVLVSKFDFRDVLEPGFDQVALQLPSARRISFLSAFVLSLTKSRGVKVLFLSNPKLAELLFLFVAKLWRRNLKAIVFDLILKAPRSFPERILAKFRTFLLKNVDRFVFIHKDISGYTKFYGISSGRCVYIPFKSNNFDLKDAISPQDGGYILSLGASHRDYPLLISAMRGLSIPLRIVLPEASMSAHNSSLGAEPLPPNIEHINFKVDRIEWSTLIANSRFVVIPLIPDVIQPAGISVYLEAMLFGKPVLISRGASTEEILDQHLAEIVPAGDLDALRSAIVKLWGNAERRAELSINGRNYCMSLKDHARLKMDLWGEIKRLC